MTRFDQSPRAELGIAAAAAFLGAAGVVLAAVAAHHTTSADLVTAANFLVMHAVAVLAIAAWAVRAGENAGPWRVAARLLLLGVALFSGQIALGALTGGSLFPMAAPLGGATMIMGWIVTAVAAIMEWRAAGR